MANSSNYEQQAVLCNKIAAELKKLEDVQLQMQKLQEAALDIETNINRLEADLADLKGENKAAKPKKKRRKAKMTVVADTAPEAPEEAEAPAPVIAA